jgi:plasmid stabilization system protein ParE
MRLLARPRWGKSFNRAHPSSPWPYIVVYQVTEHAVEISRIYHGAQDWP